MRTKRFSRLQMVAAVAVTAAAVLAAAALAVWIVIGPQGLTLL